MPQPNIPCLWPVLTTKLRSGEIQRHPGLEAGLSSHHGHELSTWNVPCGTSCSMRGWRPATMARGPWWVSTGRTSSCGLLLTTCQPAVSAGSGSGACICGLTCRRVLRMPRQSCVLPQGQKMNSYSDWPQPMGSRCRAGLSAQLCWGMQLQSQGPAGTAHVAWPPTWTKQASMSSKARVSMMRRKAGRLGSSSCMVS